MIKLYGHEVSGNSHKARLMLSLLHLNYEWIKVDLMTGEHKSPAYLAMNPFGKVPLLVDGETLISDAQAILVYLARQYGGVSSGPLVENPWLPQAAIPLSQVVKWLSTTAGEIRQGLEDARLYHLFGAETNINIDRATQKSEYILTLLEQHLATRTWLELEHPTIADVAVFPYIALARDGKISLDSYSRVLAWIERFKQLPGYVAMSNI